MYTVKQTAALTGVAEATLRAWEHRYGVVAPGRSAAGYRLYEPDDVARLRAMAALVRRGVPASVAARRVTGAPDGRPGGPVRGGVAPGGSGNPGEPAASEPRETPDLLGAARALDARVLQRVLADGFGTGSLEAVVDAWLMPQLRRLGTAWEAGELTIAEEHFVSAGLLRWLAWAFDEAGDASGDAVLVGLPAGARHDLTDLCFAVCLRRQGVDVIYLGPDVPAQEWARAVHARLPRAVVIGVHLAADVAGARAIADAVAAIHPPVSVWTGGRHAADVPGAEPLPDSLPAAARQLALHLEAGAA
ncbi:MAG: MerR family transcriptional regulator [Propionibacteriaceae bacterium]|nr:MerR family transcriptional regulator [Propionibacteriaceae bacterium]